MTGKLPEGFIAHDGRPVFYDRGKPIADRQANNLFEFCLWVAAVMRARWGGTNMQHLRTAANFSELVLGRRFSIGMPLPKEYDWSQRAALDWADEIMADV